MMTADKRLSVTVAATAATMMMKAATICQGFSATIMRISVRSPLMIIASGSSINVAKITVKFSCREPRCVVAVVRSESWRKRAMTES